MGQPVPLFHPIYKGIFFQQFSGTSGMYLFARFTVTVYACLEAAEIVEVRSLIHITAFTLYAVRKRI